MQFQRLNGKRLLAVCLVISVFVLTTVASQKPEWFVSKRTNNLSLSNSLQGIPITSELPAYVQRSAVWPQLLESLSKLGDRLEAEGKERLILQGTLSRQGATGKTAARLILELPGRLRLEEQKGSLTDVLVFDASAGKVPVKSVGNITEQDEGLIESFLLDSADNFFLSQARGLPMRYLGSRFRLEGAEAKSGMPLYDLYQVLEPVTLKSEVRQQSKVFLLNSDMQLLEKVRYQIDRAGRPVNIEVQIGGWQKAGEQRVPGTITRLEDGVPVISFTVTAASLERKANDGIFALPVAK